MLLAENFSLLTDTELYKRAKEYGLHATQWLRKFEGLLPEITHRKLYKRRGFASIHEFAAKLAGMSHEKVNRILRLAEHLQDKPNLKAIFESGAANYSKIEKVVHIATPETELAWAEKVLTVPQPALELSVRDARQKNSTNYRVEITPRGNSQPEKIFTFKMGAALEYQLRLIKQKLEKDRGQSLGFAEVFQELVKAYHSKEQKPVPKRIIQLCPKCIKETAAEAENIRK